MVRKYKSKNPKMKTFKGILFDEDKLARAMKRFADRNTKTGEKLVRGHK